MNADFRSLFQLIESLDGEVRGRESSTPPPDVAARLNAILADRKLSAEDRRLAFEALRKEPAWLEWFAEQIRKRRVPE